MENNLRRNHISFLHVEVKLISDADILRRFRRLCKPLFQKNSLIGIRQQHWFTDLLFLACHAVWVGAYRIVFKEHRADDVSKGLSTVLDVLLNMLTEIYRHTMILIIFVFFWLISLWFLSLFFDKHYVLQVKWM